MRDNFLRVVFGLLIIKLCFTIFLATSPSALATLYNAGNKFSQKFYIFSRTSGKLISDPVLYDFGEVEKGTVVEGKFRLYNGGNAILKFLNVAPGCGCTSAIVKKDILYPGESTELEFRVDTHDREAYFNSGIEVTTTEVNNPVKVLPVRGWIGKGVKLIPQGGYMGVLKAGQYVEGKVQVQFGGIGEFEIKKVKMGKGFVKIGDIIRKDEHTFEISAMLKADDVRETKDYEDTILIYTTNKEYPLLKATYRWTVTPDTDTSK